MRLLALGVDHRHAPVGLREHLAVSDVELPAVLAAIRERFAEGALISTCNRTELYVLVGHERSGRRAAIEFLCRIGDVERTQIEAALVERWQRGAVRHLFGVACGLESQILGEHQVLGQVRDAGTRAREAGSAGPLITRLFHDAVAIGKRARTETGIARNAVSISASAVELARQTLGSLRGRRALVIGAGRMGTLAARGLDDAGVQDLLVVSRTPARALALADQVGAKSARIEDVPEIIRECDVVIAATVSDGYLLTEDLVRAARARSSDRRLVIVDVAVPRDVEPAVASIPGCSLYNVDDLTTVRDEGLAARRAEAAKVEPLVDVAADRFMAWWQARELTPVIADLIVHAEAIRAAEVERAMGRLGDLSDRQRNAVNALTAAIVNKMLHGPIVRLKERGGQHDARLYVHAVRELFGLTGTSDLLDPSVEPDALGAEIAAVDRPTEP
ncbi:MAG: glutamyl-tRNA reductase [Chloroflexi bacterium]|nr:glutamyl-tRNA reductase [Chloroflexota bacterium]